MTDTFEIMYYDDYGAGLCLPKDIQKKYNRESKWDVYKDDRTNLDMISDMKKHQKICNLPQRCECKDTAEYLFKIIHHEKCPGECSCSSIKYKSVDISYREGNCWEIHDYDGLESVHLLHDQRRLLLIESKKEKQKITLKNLILELYKKILIHKDEDDHMNLVFYMGQLVQVMDLEEWKDVSLCKDNFKNLIDLIQDQ